MSVSHEHNAVPPIGPHEELSRQADRELQQQLSRLAVLHQVPEYLHGEKQNASTHSFVDSQFEEKLEGMHTAQHGSKPRRFPVSLLRSRDTLVKPEWATDEIAQEKSDMIQAVHGAIHTEARGNGKKVDWLGTANALLAKAKTSGQPEERRTLLTGAVASVQFSNNIKDKSTFLKEVYKQGLQIDTAEACEASHLVLLTRDMPKQPFAESKVHFIKQFAGAFAASEQQVTKYLHIVGTVQARNTQTSDSRKARRIQKELSDVYAAGDTANADTLSQAEKAILESKKVTGVLFDIHKVERFALQQYFIKEQMKEVLGDDLRDTPLARELKDMREVDNSISQEDLEDLGADQKTPFNLALAKLIADTKLQFTSLSWPAKRAFEEPGTEQYKAAQRYEEIRQHSQDHTEIAHFLDVTDFVQRTRDEFMLKQLRTKSNMDIMSASLNGGAVVGFGAQLIQKIVEGAADSKEAIGDVDEDELRAFAHNNRIKLLRFATIHVADINQMDAFATPKLKRDAEGRLQMVEGNGLQLPSKDQLDVYSAHILGCPALREKHDTKGEMKKAEDRLSHGSANYIDHILAVMINEAHDRGLFNVQWYRQSTTRTA